MSSSYSDDSNPANVSDSDTGDNISECRHSRLRLRSRCVISRCPQIHPLNQPLQNFYEDDELCRLSVSGKIQFGLVTTINGPDSSPSYQIIWTLGSSVEVQNLCISTTPEEISNIRLIDRKVQIGDLVRVDGREGEMIEVDFVACLKSMENNQAIVDASCDSLEPVLAYHVGQSFVLDGWLGVITALEMHASLMLPNGKTCTINLNKMALKGSKKPYPGCQITYSIDEYVKAGAEQVDSGENFVDLFSEEEISAFVFFIKVESVDIDWKVQLPIYQEPMKQPPQTLGRLALKHYAKILRPPKELSWGSDDSGIYDNYYRYAVQSDDMVLPDCKTNLERFLIKQMFPDHFADDVERSVGINNVSLVVKVLRTTRIVSVRWKDTLEVEKIKSASVTDMDHFNEPYHHIVQKTLILASSSSVQFGISLKRDTDDMVVVQWFEKDLNNSSNLITGNSSEESKFDLEPHFLYGDMIPGAIAYRNSSCKIPIAIFSLGTIQKVTAEGRIIAQDSFTKQECSFVPFDIDVFNISTKTIPAEEPKVLRSSKLYEDSFKTNYSTIGKDGQVIVTTKREFLSSELLTNYHVATLPPDDKFKIFPNAPETHHFYGNGFTYMSEYKQAVNVDREVLKGIFTEGIWVIGYQDRRDLYSAMIAGSKGSPYEDGLFHFDIQLPQNYTKTSSPHVYMTTSLSMDVGAKVRPRRMEFKKFEGFVPKTILEALLTIQLSLLTEDAFNPVPKIENAPEFDNLNKQRRLNQVRRSNSQTIIDVLDLLFRLLANPPSLWKNDIIRYIRQAIPKILSRLDIMMDQSRSYSDELPNHIPYHLLPMSRGFIKAVRNRIKKFRELSQMTAGPQ